MNLINRLSVAFLLGKSGGKGLWGRAAPDLADPDAWDPPIANLDRRSP